VQKSGKLSTEPLPSNLHFYTRISRDLCIHFFRHNMNRIILLFAFAAIISSPPLLAQAQTNFRSVGDGVWSNSQIWEENQSGVWLKPVDGVYPGERHNRDVDVTVEDGGTITIGKDEVVQINSLSVINSRLVVEGSLIVGPSQNDPNDPSIENSTTSDSISTNPVILNSDSGPQLLQNVPNPLAPQFGYETTIKFYLDKQYSHVRVGIYDQLAHLIRNVSDEQNPSAGWHSIMVRLDGIQSGTYPLVLELPNTILRGMITVLR
jgi:hypothetical protein